MEYTLSATEFFCPLAVSSTHARKGLLFRRYMRGGGCCFVCTCAGEVAVSPIHARKELRESAALFLRAGRKKDGKADPAEIAKINVFAVILKSPTPSEYENPRFFRLTPKRPTPSEREKSPFLSFFPSSRLRPSMSIPVSSVLRRSSRLRLRVRNPRFLAHTGKSVQKRP